MALTIELWTNGELVGGAEGWWDDVDLALSQQPRRNALLDLVNPYGVTVYTGDQLETLRRELTDLIRILPSRAHEFIQALIGLCNTGAATPTAELRFIGD